MSELTDQLHRAVHEAARDNRRVTHWLMTDEIYDRLRSDYGGMYLPSQEHIDHPTFQGFRIYLVDELEAPGFMLREGVPPDRERERELNRQLDAMMREYRRLSEPLIKELVEIENRKPPKPLFMTADGRLLHEPPKAAK